MAKNHDLHARRWRSRESLPKLPLSACFGRAADGSLESSSREVLQQFRLECLAEARSSVQSFLQRERELMARLPGSLGGANEEAAALFSEVAAFRAAALRERARLQVASPPSAPLPPPLPVRFRSPPPSSSQHSLPVQRVCWACDGMLRERLQRTSSPGSGVAAADVSGGARPDADADPSPLVEMLASDPSFCAFDLSLQHSLLFEELARWQEADARTRLAPKSSNRMIAASPSACASPLLPLSPQPPVRRAWSRRLDYGGGEGDDIFEWRG